MRAAAPFLAIAALGASACGPSNQLGAGEAGYYNAQLWIVPTTYVADTPQGMAEIFRVGEDGSVTAKGALVAKIVGQEIRDPQGQIMLGVTPDGDVVGPRAPKGAHFSRQGLETEHAQLQIVSELSRPVGRGWGPNYSGPYVDAAIRVRWHGGNNVLLRGHYTHYGLQSDRESILLAMLFLMKPDALAHPPG